MIKSSDVAMIIVISAIIMLGAYLGGNSLISSTGARQTKVQQVVSIDDHFPQPSTKIFNDNAINPTKSVKIGDNKTNKPFIKN